MLKLQFANPRYVADKYVVDVEAQCDVPNEIVFGINTRFHYDATKLKAGTNTNGNIAFTNFNAGYGLQNKAGCQTTQAGKAYFGFPTTPSTYVNWAIQLNNVDEAQQLPTDGWLRLFSVEIKHNGIQENFCPSLIWDTQNEQDKGGYASPNAKVISTLVKTLGLKSGSTTTKATQTICNHLNWEDFPGTTSKPYGKPVETHCI